MIDITLGLSIVLLAMTVSAQYLALGNFSHDLIPATPGFLGCITNPEGLLRWIDVMEIKAGRMGLVTSTARKLTLKAVPFGALLLTPCILTYISAMFVGFMPASGVGVPFGFCQVLGSMVSGTCSSIQAFSILCSPSLLSV